MLELSDARAEPGPARLERPPAHPNSGIESEVRDIVADIRLRGDAALEDANRLDGVPGPDRLQVDRATIADARDRVPPDLIAALEAMAKRCRQTGERCLPRSWLDRDNGELVGELVRPLRRAGISIAGRRGNPSAVITAVVAAQVAGVEGIVVCAPPSESGEIADSTLAACSLAGVDEVYRIGGARAIAAMAYGTESVRPVDLVVGNRGLDVTCAQRLVRGWVGTGPESGPSELVIVADETCTPRLVAADLMANAARGPGGTHALVTAAPDVLEEVTAALDGQVTSLAGGEDVENALIEGGRAVLVRDIDHALETVNVFAPEYLMLVVARAEEALPRVRNAAAVIVGDAVPLGAFPYLTGRGGVLPSGGRSRWDSGLSPRDFVTTIPFTGPEAAAVQSGPGVRTLAEAEGSAADRLAVGLRLHR